MKYSIAVLINEALGTSASLGESAANQAEAAAILERQASLSIHLRRRRRWPGARQMKSMSQHQCDEGCGVKYHFASRDIGQRDPVAREYYYRQCT